MEGWAAFPLLHILSRIKMCPPDKIYPHDRISLHDRILSRIKMSPPDKIYRQDRIYPHDRFYPEFKCLHLTKFIATTEFLHVTEFFSTGTARGACDKYEVWKLNGTKDFQE